MKPFDLLIRERINFIKLCGDTVHFVAVGVVIVYKFYNLNLFKLFLVFKFTSFYKNIKKMKKLIFEIQ